MPPRKKTLQRQWYRMDLHLHTPASADFKQPNVTYLDFMKKAEEKNLDAIAFTDHNSVSGYARMLEEIESLEMLERLKRLRDNEKAQLEDYRRLREKIVVFPGFEFTATLGFHILGVFPPETSVRELEHLLLSLRVPAEKLDQGSGEVGATSDVLTAYRTINEAGGLAIAAHANSSHGVAMPGFDFGGQTRIAYTQDANLHALEVTDLETTSRRRTAAFFSGTKPEYPRKMHCIQGSDAHKLDYDPKFKNEMGVGERATEIQLDDLTFDAIKAVFLGSDFSRTRPHRPTAEEPFDPIREAREQGDNLVQSFHEKLGERRVVARTILEDVVALANTNGGTIYVGASAEARKPVLGVDRPEFAITDLKNAIQKQITPPLEVQIEVLKSQGKSVLQVIVPRGSQVPYAFEESYIYVRSENETGLAVRDEIIQLVRDALVLEMAGGTPVEPKTVAKPATTTPETKVEAVTPSIPPPRTGVEIVAAEQRKGTWYYSVRDLRNNHMVRNVTLASARRLWQYAIAEREKGLLDPKALTWVGDVAIGKTYRRGGKVRYDFVQRVAGQTLVYYGVTDDGIHGPWRQLVEGEPISEETIPEVAEIEERAQIGTPAEIAAEDEASTEQSAEMVEEPTEVDSLHPLIIEEESASDIAEDEPEVETPAEPERLAHPWFEEISSAEDEMPPIESSAESQAEESPKLPEEPKPTAIVPAPESPLVPKTRAQTWREQLDRAMEEAKKTKDAGT